MPRFAVILPAAGSSSRFGNAKEKKIFSEIDGRPVWLRSVEPFLNRDDVGQIIVAIAPDDRELFMRRYGANIAFLGLTIIDGGRERFETVSKAVAAADPACDYIAVHDAARPCLAREWVDRVFQAAVEHGSSLLAIPVVDTLKSVNPTSMQVTGTVPRAGLYQAQTPQVFRRDWLEAAHQARQEKGWDVTDDVQLLEMIGRPCVVVPGSPLNLKITTQEDLVLAKAAIAALPQPVRKGPANPFAAEESMWIGDFPEPPHGLV
jgi:2-C-methyl-D-erythritol 4-phosphate cytidylyltransferase